MKVRVAVLMLVALSSCGSMSGVDGGEQTGGGSAATGGGSASTGGVAASTGGGSASTGGGSASTGGGTGATGGGAGAMGGGAGATGGGYEVFWDGGAAIDGGDLDTRYAFDWVGQNGQRIEGTCPAQPSPGTVWGTDLYTNDSSICLAAIHVGVLQQGVGGVAIIEIRPGAPSYTGTTRNGITTRDYPAYNGSFAFVGDDGGLVGNVSVPDAGFIDAGVQFAWGDSAQSWLGPDGTRVTGTCPTGGDDEGIWGTDLYTDDSSICTAAVHVGVITFDGGVVTFEIRPGELVYAGTTRNGVTSSSYGMWPRSFAIVP
ncbi:MAG: LCCL domain-containing protein [Archangium sp.]